LFISIILFPLIVNSGVDSLVVVAVSMMRQLIIAMIAAIVCALQHCSQRNQKHACLSPVDCQQSIGNG